MNHLLYLCRFKRHNYRFYYFCFLCHSVNLFIPSLVHSFNLTYDI